MSGLQGETNYSAGGGAEGGEKKHNQVQVSRPDPAAVRAYVEQQIRGAKHEAAAAKRDAMRIYAETKSRIADKNDDEIRDASIARKDREFEAIVPVLVQEVRIEELEKQLRRAKLDLNAKKVVFSAKKGELKTAYKTAVAGIKETTKADIDSAKTARAQAVIAAEEALTEARTQGVDAVREEEALADAYDNWQSDMKWAGRKAGFNAVAATVKAIVEAVQTTYRENRDAARANVAVPAILLKREQSSAPQPPAAA
jgi:hypothetical protein